MERTFPDTLSLLRRERNISQRKVAADLNISQALLSHYENGAREPGLSFVCKVCDYYGVSADYLLCRSEQPNATRKTAEAAKTILDELNTLVDRAKLVLDEFAPEGDLE